MKRLVDKEITSEDMKMLVGATVGAIDAEIDGDGDIRSFTLVTSNGVFKLDIHWNESVLQSYQTFELMITK